MPAFTIIPHMIGEWFFGMWITYDYTTQQPLLSERLFQKGHKNQPPTYDALDIFQWHAHEAQVRFSLFLILCGSDKSNRHTEDAALLFV